MGASAITDAFGLTDIGVHEGRNSLFLMGRFGWIQEMDLSSLQIKKAYPYGHGWEFEIDEELDRLYISGTWGLEVLDLETGRILRRAWLGSVGGRLNARRRRTCKSWSRRGIRCETPLAVWVSGLAPTKAEIVVSVFAEHVAGRRHVTKVVVRQVLERAFPRCRRPLDLLLERGVEPKLTFRSETAQPDSCGKLGDAERDADRNEHEYALSQHGSTGSELLAIVALRPYSSVNGTPGVETGSCAGSIAYLRGGRASARISWLERFPESSSNRARYLAAVSSHRNAAARRRARTERRSRRARSSWRPRRAFASSSAFPRRHEFPCIAHHFGDARQLGRHRTARSPSS